MPSVRDIGNLCQQGRNALRHREYAQAIKFFQDAIKLDEDCVEAHQGLGAAFFHAQKLDAAVEHFTRWMQLQPKEAKPYINLGAVYNRMGNHQKAADLLQRAIQKDSNSFEAYYNLGIAYRNLDRFGMAMNAYKEAIRLNPEAPDVHQNLANVYRKMNNHRKAIEHFERALEIDPDFARAKRGLAKAQEEATSAQKGYSPFGRLVDEAALAEKKSDADIRALSVQERFEDRRILRELTDEIQEATVEWLEHLRTSLSPAILAVNRAIGQKQTSSLATAQDALHDALKKHCALRELLKRRLDKLREHEREIKS